MKYLLSLLLVFAFDVLAATFPATAYTGAIQIGYEVSRTIGVAPLSVFFDASGTVATGVARPFHELDYTWDFDSTNVNPAIGVWGDKPTGSNGNGVTQSRKIEYSPVAAHVYETPGTYTVTLAVRNLAGQTVSQTIGQIVVQDPNAIFSSTTVCINPTGDSDFTGCPTSCPSANCISNSDFDVTLSAQLTAGKKRILFKRGGTFQSDTQVNWTVAGPGHIGAYGSGAKPIILGTASIDMIVAGGASFSDWRITDLDINMNNAGTLVRFLKVDNLAENLLVKDMLIRDGYQGIDFTGNYQWRSLATLQDNTFSNMMSNPTNGQAFYGGGYRIAYLGNLVDTTRSHNSRLFFLHRAIVAHNTYINPGASGNGVANLKLPSIDWETDTRMYSERVTVTGNKFVSGSGNWQLELQPQSTHNHERHRNYIVEKNLFAPTSTFGAMPVLGLSGESMTVRSNVFNLSGAPSAYEVIQLHREGTCTPQCEPDPTNLFIYHNTIYTDQVNSGSTPNIIRVDSTVSSAFPATIKNNLGYAPNKGPSQLPRMIYDLATGTIASNNSRTTPTNDVVYTNPNFTNAATGNFKPTGPTYMLGDDTVPVIRDFNNALLPTSNRSIGAIAH